MSGFSDPIAAGDGDLIRARIKSPNYVAGATGWSINQAGDAEFNNVTMLGALYLPDGKGGYIRIRITSIPRIELRPDNDSSGLTNYAAAEIYASGIGNPDLSLLGPYDQNVTTDRATLILRGASAANPLIPSAAGITGKTIELFPVVATIVWGNLQAGTINQTAPGKIASGVASTGSLAYSAEVSTTDSVPRFVIRGDGLMGWGPGGSTARDTNLYRAGASKLQTDDAFYTGSHAYGVVTITPVANTPTSTNVTGLSLVTGLTYNGYASARTTVVGSTVQGVATTSATATGVTVWVYRTNTTNTNVDWMVVGQ